MTTTAGSSAAEAPHVTVLTAARNAEAYLDEAIDSVRAQTFGDWELVIVDDASDDATPDIIARHTRADDRIRSLRRWEQGGPARGANDGLAIARGRYIARLDADDIALPHRLERQLAFLNANPSLRACTSDVQVLVDRELRELGPRATPTLPGSLDWGLAVRGFLQSTLMVEKAALDEIGGYADLRVSEDHHVYCRLARRRWLGAIAEPLVLWRKHEGQLTDRSLDLLQQLGAQVVAEHLSEIDSQPWTVDDALRLRGIGRRAEGLREGLTLIARFARAWRSDRTLTAAERRELIALTRQLRRDHLKTLTRERLDSVAVGGGMLRVYRRVRAAARS